MDFFSIIIYNIDKKRKKKKEKKIVLALHFFSCNNSIR